ncbi:MAG TPA: hypothetical protein VLM37_08755 [Fibrobacteraceae bacterium]|nr:hypothetical protein [Fibrobacteraceae bacterium]
MKLLRCLLLLGATSLWAGASLFLCAGDPPLERPLPFYQESNRIWSLFVDTLRLPPPHFLSLQCTDSLVRDSGIAVSRAERYWPKSYREILKRRGYWESQNPTKVVLALSPDLPESELPVVVAHELFHAFHEQLSQQASRSRWGEALATWAEWRAGFFHPYKQPMPWDMKRIHGFFDVPEKSSYGWWPIFAVLPDSQVISLLRHCPRSCSSQQVDSLFPGLIASAMLDVAKNAKIDPERWLKHPPRNFPESRPPPYSFQYLHRCPSSRDTTNTRCLSAGAGFLLLRFK